MDLAIDNLECFLCIATIDLVKHNRCITNTFSRIDLTKLGCLTLKQSILKTKLSQNPEK